MNFAVVSRIIFISSIFCINTVISSEMQCRYNNLVLTINMDLSNDTCKLIKRDDYQPVNVEFYLTQKHESDTNMSFSTWKRKPCQPNPCMFGSRCTFAYVNRTDEYDCDSCPFPMGGKNCSELACNTTCFRFNDMVFFIYPNNSDTWQKSYQKCVDNGLEMTTIKDKRTHRFLQSYFNKQKHFKELPIGYWIGLKRSRVDTPWTWVDGSLLRSNDAWFITHRRLHDNLCAILVKSDLINYEMVSRPCVAPFYMPTHTLCQKKFSFLRKFLYDGNNN